MAVVEYDCRDGIGRVTLNRPRVLNASNLEMKRALHDILAAAASAQDCRAVVITGAGRGFCVGGDMKEADSFSAKEYADAIELQHAVCVGIRNLNKPVIAAINGYALGGGLEMAMMCDIRIVAASAKLGIPVVKVGSVSTAGLYHQLIRVIGLARTTEMALTAEPVDAREALRIGLVKQVVDDAVLPEAAGGLARKIAAHSSRGIALCKMALRQASDVSFEAMLAFNAAMAVRSRAETPY